MNPPGSPESGWWILARTFCLMLVGICLPLLLSGLEYLTTKTDYVEDACRYVGIHETLSRLYNRILDPFD